MVNGVGSKAFQNRDYDKAKEALVNANRELITRFEQKIQATIARIWGEEKMEKG